MPQLHDTTIRKPDSSLRHTLIAWRSSTFTLIAWTCMAIVLLFASDLYMRQQQNLPDAIKAGTSPVFLPLGDMLHEQLLTRQKWFALQSQVKLARKIFQNKNLDTQTPPLPATVPTTGTGRNIFGQMGQSKTNAADRNNKDKPNPLSDYFKITYDNDDFISQHIGATDPRRKHLLLSIVQLAPYHPQSVRAYNELFNEDWMVELGKDYPQYADHLTKIALSLGRDEKLTVLLTLADMLHRANRTALELSTLELVHRDYQVRFSTFVAMEQLAKLLPSGSEKQTALKQQITQYNVQREALIDRAKWYFEFETNRKKKTPEQIEQIIDSGGQVMTDPFTASAAATFVEQSIRAGDMQRANRWRKQLALFDLANAEEAGLVFDWILIQQGDPNKRPNLSPPDLASLVSQKWRGLVDLERYDEADDLYENQFGRDWWPAYMTAHKALVSQDWDAIKPAAMLDRVPESPILSASSAPANVTIPTSGDCYESTMELSPASGGVKADIHTRLTMTLTPTEVIFVIVADEPREAKSLPKLKATRRDEDVSLDDSIELFFGPDQTPEFYHYLAFNRDRVIRDATTNVSFMDGKITLRPDNATDLGAKIIVLSSPPGTMSWQVTLPREKVFPVDQTAIRFNARRFRYILEGNRSIPHIYTWAPIRDQQPHPELFGWIVNPELLQSTPKASSSTP